MVFKIAVQFLRERRWTPTPKKKKTCGTYELFGPNQKVGVINKMKVSKKSVLSISSVVMGAEFLVDMRFIGNLGSVQIFI